MYQYPAHFQLNLFFLQFCRRATREAEELPFQAPERKHRWSAEREDRQRTRTSYTEYEVDASALKAEEGRGDRRNVPGELHASDEPGESEWGNPSRVMSGHRLLNT